MIFFGALSDKFEFNLMLLYHNIYQIDAEKASSNGAIWDEFSEQH